MTIIPVVCSRLVSVLPDFGLDGELIGEMNNTQRITLMSFLAYFVMSGMLAPIGIISGPMSEIFDLPVTDITAQFSWLTMGILAGSVLALILFDKVPLKSLMTFLYGLILLSLLSLTVLNELTVIGVALGIVGVCCGLGLAGAALVISRTYDGERRASMLVITDSFFSIAGFVCAAIATFLVSRSFHWAGVYQFVAVVATAVLLLTVVSRFPSTTISEQNTADKQTWPMPVWFCLSALFLYTLGQYSMLWWLPNYAETELGASREQAGRLVSLFWFGMFAAQLVVAWWVLRVGVRRLVMIAGVSTSLFSIPLWLYEDIAGLSVLAFLWGFANLGLLKIVLSFATQMLPLPSGRLVSSLLLGATLGTALSPWVTSQIVVATNNHFILQFSTACYVTLTCLLYVATRKLRS